MDWSLFQSLLVLSGAVVLVFGMRAPQWTSFGIGFGMGLWSVHHVGLQFSGPTVVIASIAGGLITGALFFVVRRLLPLAVGVVVGGYLFWAVPWTSFYSAWMPQEVSLYAVPCTVALLIGLLFVMSRWSIIIERILISLSGSLLVCAGLERMGEAAWVIGIATVSLAIDGLLRE